MRFDSIPRRQTQANIELRKNGYVPLRYSWGDDVRPDPPADVLTFRLRRGMTMGGIVVGVADRPVEGVTVVMTVSRYGPGKRPKNAVGDGYYYEVPSRTGPDGKWRTDSVRPAAEVDLQLIHPGLRVRWVPHHGGEGAFSEAAALRHWPIGRSCARGWRSAAGCSMSGKPIVGAKVVDSTRGLVFLDYVWSTFTDAEGNFHVHLPRDAKMSLTVQVAGYQPAMREVSAEVGAPPVEFRLPRGRMLRGRVVTGWPADRRSCRRDPELRQVQGVSSFDGGPTPKAASNGQRAQESMEFSIGAEDYGDRSRLAHRERQGRGHRPRAGFHIRLRVIDAETGDPIPEFGTQIGTAEPGTTDLYASPRNEGSSGELPHPAQPHGAGALYQIKSSPTLYSPQSSASSAARRGQPGRRSGSRRARNKAEAGYFQP